MPLPKRPRTQELINEQNIITAAGQALITCADNAKQFGLINTDQLKAALDPLLDTSYGQNVLKLRRAEGKDK